jgi:hypothetical protein
MKLKLGNRMQRVPMVNDDILNETNPNKENSNDLMNQPYYFDDLTIEKANEILKSIKKVLRHIAKLLYDLFNVFKFI